MKPTTADTSPADARRESCPHAAHGARRRPFAAALLALALVGLPGCAATRLSHQYEPSPAEIAATGTTGADAARVLVSVIAIERWQRNRHNDFGVSLRLRIENGGDSPLMLRRDQLLLLDAELNTFGPPSWSSPPTSVPARGTLTVDLWVPLPDGAELRDVDLEGLNLRFALDDGHEPMRPLSASFTRTRRPVIQAVPHSAVFIGYGPTWYPGYGPYWYHGYGSYGGYRW